ncbi:MAG TPA: helix-turn-helix transcriptional regulator [Acholeplasmataceae bacterium]|nr:helix-turn-helix transcriptional regulator [Acholeplasmataceae bacterium]
MKKEFNITCMNKVRRIMEIFGGKWVFIVIGQLSLGTKRFNDLVSELNITPRQLSDVLKHLEANEIVIRDVYPTSPVTIEYSLTKRGNDFNDVFLALDAWAEKWLDVKIEELSSDDDKLCGDDGCEI